MAKKKKSRKTRRAHIAGPATNPPVSQAVSPPVQAAGDLPAAGETVTAPAAPAVVAETRQKTGDLRLGHVGGDIRRIGLIVGGCVLLEAALWYLFIHTGIGTQIYSWVNL